jgi:hypothetical protein
MWAAMSPVTLAPVALSSIRLSCRFRRGLVTFVGLLTRLGQFIWGAYKVCATNRADQDKLGTIPFRWYRIYGHNTRRSD